jgi:predicted short-subunit dehydrogenase-like oxidoreductase (DUF2520 family)
MFGKLHSIGFIGAGKVGGTLARLWYDKGYAIDAVYSRTPAHARALASAVGAEAVTTPEAVVAASDLTVLTVPDDSIMPLAEQLAQAGGSLAGKAVIHTSGARDVRALEALAGAGASVGSLHPAFPFADVETALRNLSGVAFAVEAEDERLRRWLLELVAALNGSVLAISPGGKVLYHAALVFASNYVVTLYALAERLLMSLGAERTTADAALNPLISAAVENLQTRGIPDALTGPLTRADVGTVSQHLQALETVDSEAAKLYRQLARMTLPLAAARGISVEALKRLLAQEEEHENNDT